MSNENLLPINNQYYYLDIDTLSEYIKITPNEIQNIKVPKRMQDDFNPTTMINVTKYDTVKLMIDVIMNMGFSMDDHSDLDDTEKLIKGMSNTDDLDSMPLPFKLAFNTLTINQIIKNHEPTNRKTKRIDPEAKK